LDQPLYTVSQFAKKASVSVRTLRYYDKAGLLSPSQYSAAGYRLYADEDLVQLQYILALKFLGFSLEEIKACLDTGPHQLQARLAQQKAMMLEKRTQLDRIIRGIEQTQHLLQTGTYDSESMTQMIQVIQMEHKDDLTQHLTLEQRQKMKEIVEESYSEEGLTKLKERTWSPEETKLQQDRYTAFREGLAKVVAAGADPASPEAQAVVELLRTLNYERSQGDPAILAGMRKTWEAYNALPDHEKPQTYNIPEEERAFLVEASQIFYKKKAQSERESL
jgi:DNA-binding transcriptional MerR regulator